MDKVLIERLLVYGVVGVHPEERIEPRELWIDLELAQDNRVAAATDQISDVLDYDAVGRCLRDYVANTRFMLIETLAERCVTLLHAKFGVPWIRLTLWKPGAVAFAANVGVRIERVFENA